jgi:hypothetical protein
MLAAFEAATAHWDAGAGARRIFHAEIRRGSGRRLHRGAGALEARADHPPGKSILQCVREAGIQVPHSCEGRRVRRVRERA